MLKTFLTIVSLLAGSCLGGTGARAQAEVSGPAVHFNQMEIAALRLPALEMDDWRSVLDHILSSAGSDIVVYPSEGYYYFRFQNGPRLVSGNLRFDLMDAARGELNFAYYSGAAFGEDPVDYYGLLGPSDGVDLRSTGPFEYELRFQGRLTRVHIYRAEEELAGPKPVATGELYVGPVFDESGVRLHLVFDEVTRAFFFILNEAAPAGDTFSSYPGLPSIQVGDRTGYAFYADGRRGRRILVGVARRNILANSYFDGPFDQLPDRFVDPGEMQRLMVLAYPDLEGVIGPRGVYLDTPFMRAMVAPYRRYESVDEFADLGDCGLVEDDHHALTNCLQSFAYR